MATSFDIIKGATFTLDFIYKINDVAVDITGKDVVFHLVPVLSDGRQGTDYLALSSADSPTPHGSKLEVTDASGGAFTLTIADEETKEFFFENAGWWISLETGGAKTPIGRAQITVSNPI